MVKRRPMRKMQNQQTNGHAPSQKTPLADDNSKQPITRSKFAPYGLNKCHRPVIDIESSENSTEAPPSKQSNPKLSLPTNATGGTFSAHGTARTKNVVHKPRSENERYTKKQFMRTRNGNRQLEKIPVSTRVAQSGGQFRKTQNSPQILHIERNSSSNQSETTTYKLQLKGDEPHNMKNANVLEENLLFTTGSKTPEPTDNQSSEHSKIENEILPEQSVETNEVAALRSDLLLISTEGTNDIEVDSQVEVPEIPSAINAQTTENNEMVNVSMEVAETLVETRSFEHTVQDSPGSLPPFSSWTSINRVRSIELDIFKNDRAVRETQSSQPKPFKNPSRTSRGKSNPPKTWSSPKQSDRKNENTDCLARLIETEEAVRQKFERESERRKYVLMFLPEAFDSGSLDEKSIAGLYGRFNVDEVKCHYNKDGDRIGSGTMRVWNQHTERVEQWVPDRKWRALKMTPLRKRDVSESDTPSINVFVKFLNDWPEEKLESFQKVLRDACPGSDIQMIYDYNNQSIKSAFGTVKYSDIEKLHDAMSWSNDLIKPLQVQIFEVAGAPTTVPVQ